MDENTMTLRQLTAPNLNTQPLAVTYPGFDDGTKFELRAQWVHFLPKFQGLSGENPNKHLQEFQSLMETIRPSDVTEDQINLRAFPLTFKDAANDWFYYLPAETFDTWTD